MKYDVFISYRCDGGDMAAIAIADKLRHAGHNVFLDIDILSSGNFNTQLYSFIEQCKDFVLILPENGLDKCSNEDDWVRLEILHAMRHNKNIIPIMLRKFEWPKTMPKGLEELSNYQSIKANDREYFDAYIEKLKRYLKSKPKPSKSKYMVMLICAVIGVVLLGTAFYLYWDGSTAPTPPIVEEQTILNVDDKDIASKEITKNIEREKEDAKKQQTEITKPKTPKVALEKKQTQDNDKIVESIAKTTEPKVKSEEPKAKTEAPKPVVTSKPQGPIVYNPKSVWTEGTKKCQILGITVKDNQTEVEFKFTNTSADWSTIISLFLSKGSNSYGYYIKIDGRKYGTKSIGSSTSGTFSREVGANESFTVKAIFAPIPRNTKSLSIFEGSQAEYSNQGSVKFKDISLSL